MATQHTVALVRSSWQSTAQCATNSECWADDDVDESTVVATVVCSPERNICTGRMSLVAAYVGHSVPFVKAPCVCVCVCVCVHDNALITAPIRLRFDGRRSTVVRLRLDYCRPTVLLVHFFETERCYVKNAPTSSRSRKMKSLAKTTPLRRLTTVSISSRNRIVVVTNV